MKISRLMAITVLGLGLISQQTFPYGKDVKKQAVKPTAQPCKQECHKSAFPLFQKKEHKTDICKCKDMKHSEKTAMKDKNHKAKHSKHHKNVDMSCGAGCHKSVLPLFNKKENRSCVCKKHEKAMPAANGKVVKQ